MNKEKIDGKTMNLTIENLNKLKELFPEIFNEDKIDFDKLQNLLGNHIDSGLEKYQMTWKGKMEAIRLVQKQSTGTLRPCIEESKDWDKTENLYIEGDNLEVLKLLQSSYLNKIKMIYIDPPYNTGNDFVYEDDFADNIQNYKQITGQATKSNAETQGRYHTNWLNMMYPRLKLARNLLTDDGVIFISIDDNEQANLKKLCDEIFGENNFVTNQIINSAPAGSQSSNTFAIQHSYCLVYRKSEKFNTIPIKLTNKESKKKYNYGFDNNGNYYIERLWKRGAGGRKEDVPSLHFPVFYNETTNEILIDDEIDKHLKKSSFNKIIPFQTFGVLGRWTWSKAKMKNERETLIVVKIAGEWKLHKKVYEQDESGKKPYTIIDSSLGRTELGSLEIRKILNGKYFDYPKASKLIKYFISICTKNNDIVLDFFSGSATTAHAVIGLNAEDGGNRKFIMVQLPELIEENSEAYKAGYKNICEIGKERIRRAGEKNFELKKLELEEKINSYQKIFNEKTKTEFLLRQDEIEITQNEKDIQNAMKNGNLPLNNILNKNNNKLEGYWERKDKLSNQNQELEKCKKDLEETQKQLQRLREKKDFDIGFKVFKLDTSNIKKWDNSPTESIEEVKNRIQKSLFYLTDGRTDIDAVYEIMLKFGLPLTLPVNKKNFGNAETYIIENNDYKILICLSKSIKIKEVEEMTNESIGTYIFADRCFSDANDLINTEELLKKKDKQMRLF